MGGKKGEVKDEGEDSAKHIAKKICAEKKTAVNRVRFTQRAES